MIFILILLLCFSASFAQTIAVDKVVRNFLFDGLWADEHFMSEHVTESMSKCAAKCRLTDTCASFFYRPVAPQCQLIPFIRYIPDYLIGSAGSKYYTRESATNFSLPPTPADPFTYNTFLLSDGSVTSLRVVQTAMNFTAAQDNCTAEGATLARITTVPKMQLFQYILRSWDSVTEYFDHWISGLPQVNGSQWVTEHNEVIPTTRDFWLGFKYSNEYYYEYFYPSTQDPDTRAAMFYTSYFFKILPWSVNLYSICEKL